MSNSAFKRHGIERLSASSLNLWLDSPGVWSLKYLGGLKEETSAAMARGKAVEDGMLQMLHGKPIEKAIEVAINTFWTNMAGEASEENLAEEALIKPMLTRIYEWNPSPKILGSQVKIEHWLDKVSIPIIGYVDFNFEEHPLLDLKTTKRIPSEPRPDHVRQVSLYRKSRREKGALLYVSDKRVAQYEVTDAMADDAMGQLEAAALSLERFLSAFTNSQDAIRCLPMNTDSYRFSQEAKLKVMEMRL